ncbi:MAG: hypothetical protein SGJ27_17095 [Candidatus Melainabacteria bacterium]|nr:hypothetical protein [Candidatus Melainabacteria bacterium]
MDSELKDQLAQIGKKTEWQEEFALLNKKVDDQFRFTRSVIVLCTLAHLGLTIFTILATFQSLPSQMTAQYMSNLEPVVRLWRQYEMLLDNQERVQRQPGVVTPVAPE